MVARAGILLMAMGVGLFGYLGWQLYGTGATTAQAQRLLESEWGARDQLVAAEVSADRPVLESPYPSKTAPLKHGVAKLQFPAAVSEKPLIVVKGVGTEALKRGPGMYPQSEQPGDVGNFAVAGHRTTYGAPFSRLDELERGDVVRVTDRRGVVRQYEVRDKSVVQPDEVWVIDDDPLETGEPTLTLTTCHPRYSARQRLIVHAVLDGPAAPTGKVASP